MLGGPVADPDRTESWSVSDPILVVLFLASAGVSLGTSWLLVSRLERVGVRFAFTEALLGMVAALAADAPEITASATAMAGNHARIGAGVVIGSNVFNLAALLGLSAVIAGRIALHRRVVLMEGVVAVSVALICVAVVTGLISPVAGLVLAGCAIGPYVVLLGVPHERLARARLPARLVGWLAGAVHEEEIEVEPSLDLRFGGRTDAVVALVAVAVVVGASVAMEQTASKFGTRHAVPDIVVGGIVLAAVTSLPNAVAAIYLARRGRGAATLSAAMNSNALNVAVGLLVPAVIVGLKTSSGQATLIAAWYLAMTALALPVAWFARGFDRRHGALTILAYAAFCVAVLVTA
jgi:cation:H+ antiporter